MVHFWAVFFLILNESYLSVFYSIALSTLNFWVGQVVLGELIGELGSVSQAGSDLRGFKWGYGPHYLPQVL